MSAKKGGARPQRQAHTYEVKDIVLGKVRGYAPWPGMVVDPNDVPPAVAQDRPSNKKTTFYCVRFFPGGEHAWLVEKDISKLQPSEISAYINGAPASRRGGELLEGYKIAQDPTAWLASKAAELEAQLGAASGSATDADAEEDDEEDQLDSESVATGQGGAGGKRKRKRADDGATSAKKAKAAKASKAKDAAVASASAKKGASARGKRGAKSREAVESEDDGEGEPEDESASVSAKPGAGKSAKAKGGKKEASPAPAKKKGEDEGEAKSDDPEAIKVRDWRHKLQKSFLSNKAVPKDEDMPALDELFKTIEDFGEMTIEHLQFSKIGKVMRHIAALPEDKVPRDVEFKFRERSDVLVKKWHQILNATKGANGTDTSLANGTAKETSPAKEDKENVNVGINVDNKPEGKKDESAAVTEGTAALDLNGKDADATAEADAPGEADTAMEGDVTMAEA